MAATNDTNMAIDSVVKAMEEVSLTELPQKTVLEMLNARAVPYTASALCISPCQRLACDNCKMVSMNLITKDLIERKNKVLTSKDEFFAEMEEEIKTYKEGEEDAHFVKKGLTPHKMKLYAIEFYKMQDRIDEIVESHGMTVDSEQQPWRAAAEGLRWDARCMMACMRSKKPINLATHMKRKWMNEGVIFDPCFPTLYVKDNFLVRGLVDELFFLQNNHNIRNHKMEWVKNDDPWITVNYASVKVLSAGVPMMRGEHYAIATIPGAALKINSPADYKFAYDFIGNVHPLWCVDPETELSPVEKVW